MHGRRLSSPYNHMATLTGGQLGGRMQTAVLFPEFTPSEQYDDVSKGFWWSHFHKSRRLWQHFMYLVSTVIIMEYTLVPSMMDTMDMKFYSVFLFLDFCQMLDIFIILRTPYMSDGLLKTGPPKVMIEHYGRTRFIIQCISALPFGWIGVMTHNLIVYMVLSANRLLRINHMFYCFNLFKESPLYSNKLTNIYTSTIIVFLVSHVYACIYYLMAVNMGYEGSYIAVFPEAEHSLVEKYVISLYFALVNCLSVTSGNIQPQNPTEKGLAIVLNFVGVYVIFYVMVKMIDLLEDKDGDKVIQEFKSNQAFFKRKNIDSKPFDMYRHFCQCEFFLKHGVNTDEQLFESIPSTIKIRYELNAMQKTFQKIELFSGMNKKFLLLIIDSMKSFIYTPGELIYNKEDISDTMYIFNSGMIEVGAEDDPKIIEIKDGYIDGISHLIFDGRQPHTLRAYSFVEGWSITKDQFAAVMYGRQSFSKIVEFNAKRLFPNDLKKIKEVVRLWNMKDQIIHKKKIKAKDPCFKYPQYENFIYGEPSDSESDSDAELSD